MEVHTYSQEKLVWLFGNQPLINKKNIEGSFVGPRATMITPWSTNAVEITQNMDIDLNGMFKYMVENFIVKTEPKLSAIDILRLTPYIGDQIKEILPNPLSDSGDEEKNE